MGVDPPGLAERVVTHDDLDPTTIVAEGTVDWDDRALNAPPAATAVTGTRHSMPVSVDLEPLVPTT